MELNHDIFEEIINNVPDLKTYSNLCLVSKMMRSIGKRLEENIKEKFGLVEKIIQYFSGFVDFGRRCRIEIGYHGYGFHQIDIVIKLPPGIVYHQKFQYRLIKNIAMMYRGRIIFEYTLHELMLINQTEKILNIDWTDNTTIYRLYLAKFFGHSNNSHSSLYSCYRGIRLLDMMYRPVFFQIEFGSSKECVISNQKIEFEDAFMNVYYFNPCHAQAIYLDECIHQKFYRYQIKTLDNHQTYLCYHVGELNFVES